MRDRLYTAFSTGVIFAASLAVIIAGLIVTIPILMITWAMWTWDKRKRRSGCQTKC